ncbi:MAG: type II toxin-antitoxin system RelE/ParE family toxin [Verrucomicrobiales bacterium]|nr:type II toxin-antitoxin system RelE/ParE family toxin [Verrucomicrobiales bacterium]
MAFEIELTDDAREDYRALDAHLRAIIRKAMETHLRNQPTKVSKSRIKRLRELRRPQYRLRVESHRIYYDVEDSTVTILGIVAKDSSESWLRSNSEPDEKND